MTSKKQTKANKKNAQKSTGPKDYENTKYNAVKYGLTSKSFFSKEDEKAINNIYEDLKQILVPQDRLQAWVLGRIALYIWRLQKSAQIEQKQLQNSLIKSHNKNADETRKLICLNSGEKDELIGEDIDTNIDLIMRYEVTNENRLIKLINFLQKLQA